MPPAPPLLGCKPDPIPEKPTPAQHRNTEQNSLCAPHSNPLSAIYHPYTALSIWDRDSLRDRMWPLRTGRRCRPKRQFSQPSLSSSSPSDHNGADLPHRIPLTQQRPCPGWLTTAMPDPSTFGGSFVAIRPIERRNLVRLALSGANRTKSRPFPTVTGCPVSGDRLADITASHVDSDELGAPVRST